MTQIIIQGVEHTEPVKFYINFFILHKMCTSISILINIRIINGINVINRQSMTDIDNYITFE